MDINNTAWYGSSISAYTSSIQTGNLSISGSYLEITGGASVTASTDDVDISEMAQQLLERIRNLDVFSIIFPDRDVRARAQSLGEIEQDFFNDFDFFSTAFTNMHAMLGFESSMSFTMGLDGTGGLTVSGSDDNAAATMQNTLSSNSTVVARFAIMAARAALVDASQTVDGFNNAYANDPYAAVTDYMEDLKERLLGFRTTGDSSTVMYGFVREFSLSIEYSSRTATAGMARSAV